MIRALAGMLLLVAAGGAAAQPVDDLERDDALALSAAWRLEAGNVRYCDLVAPQTGIQLEDTSVYADPALVRSTYGLVGDIYVGALAETGPGQKAGLRVNMTIAAIDGQDVSALPAPARADPFTRLHQVQDLLDAAAARDGAVSLTTADHRTFRVTAERACRVTVKVDDNQSYANATRDEIRIGRRYVDATGGDPDLVAALIAHEMAHALLNHQALIAASHRAIDVERRTEREADRLSVWLLANAGYPPEAASRLQRTVIVKLTGPLGLDPTHGSPRSRAALVDKETVEMRAAPDRNWMERFVRESRSR